MLRLRAARPTPNHLRHLQISNRRILNLAGFPQAVKLVNEVLSDSLVGKFFLRNLDLAPSNKGYFFLDHLVVIIAL